MFHTRRILSAGVALSVLAALASAVVCVAAGGSTTVTGTRPKDPPAGTGNQSQWDKNPPHAEEHDSTSSNDDMGEATENPSNPQEASAQVSNTGGNLSGPNGKTQNGGAEGDCIEVIITWKWYLWWGDIENGWWEQYEWSSPATEVCPCGSSDCPAGTPPC